MRRSRRERGLTREDVLLNKVDRPGKGRQCIVQRQEGGKRALSVALKPRLRHRDDLHDRQSTIHLEHAIHGLKVRVEELLADGLNHLDTNDAVERVRERGRERAVVEEVHRDRVRQTCCGDTSFGEDLLLNGESESVDGAARRANRL